PYNFFVYTFFKMRYQQSVTFFVVSILYLTHSGESVSNGSFHQEDLHLRQIVEQIRQTLSVISGQDSIPECYQLIEGVFRMGFREEWSAKSMCVSKLSPKCHFLILKF